jgi:site-specific recombinase XerD
VGDVEGLDCFDFDLPEQSQIIGDKAYNDDELEDVLDTALFLTAVKKPMGKRAVQLMLEKYLAVACIENASVQSLRHTMAVHHLAKGTPLKTLAEILGDDPSTLQIYMLLGRKVHHRALQENAL